MFATLVGHQQSSDEGLSNGVFVKAAATVVIIVVILGLQRAVVRGKDLRSANVRIPVLAALQLCEALSFNCQDIGLQAGCRPPARLNFRWPLAIDLIVEAFSADKQGLILEFFVKIVSQTDNTFEQVILGGRGIDTQDPENIEAILSSQFNGKQLRVYAAELSQSA
jgi:hypothetical protein